MCMMSARIARKMCSGKCMKDWWAAFRLYSLTGHAEKWQPELQFQET
jgi:hypothetical protein